MVRIVRMGAAAFTVFAAAPGFLQVKENSAESAALVVTGIRKDISYAPKQPTVADKTPTPLIEIPQTINVAIR